ncbi:odorant receptor 131-2-like [Mixophyes fleayi]|uniref:odorant receptor 131-2-like n=1 Tax=Mixophyes fleayi TaxID=3061075 RepID=UPI003F4D8A90
MRTSSKRFYWSLQIMIDTKAVYINTTDNQSIEIVRGTVLTLIVLSFCIFLYFATIMLHVFFTDPHIRENARYVLFAHMLMNDALLLYVSVFLFTAVIYVVYIPVPICYALVCFSVCTFSITPYNLAVMSLERYFAICYPLRHTEFCTVQRSLTAIGIMWILGLFPLLLDFIAMCFSMQSHFFSLSLICLWPAFAMNQVQSILRTFTVISSFTMVALVILYTYVKVMLVARKIGSDKSAFRAQRTVLLHAFQLVLCMTSFTSTFTEAYLKKYFFFIHITNFFLFMCIPRFISPLIYGVRDEAFRKYMRKMNFSV